MSPHDATAKFLGLIKKSGFSKLEILLHYFSVGLETVQSWPNFGATFFVCSSVVGGKFKAGDRCVLSVNKHGVDALEIKTKVCVIWRRNSLIKRAVMQRSNVFRRCLFCKSTTRQCCRRKLLRRVEEDCVRVSSSRSLVAHTSWSLKHQRSLHLNTNIWLVIMIFSIHFRHRR